jgi:Major Facilitator Superfamily.
MTENANLFRRTAFSCFNGIFVEAIILNITPILFVPLMDLYGFTYAQLGLLVGVNFGTQVLFNVLASRFVDRLGFRRLVLPATLLAFGGMVLFAFSPMLFGQGLFTGLILSTVVFACAGGIYEVVLTPVINAIPRKRGPAISLMHSIYAWGQVAIILCTTLFLYVAGQSHWQEIVLVWAAVPLVNYFMFYGAKMPDLVPEEHRLAMRDIFFNPFYLFALLAMFFGCASEVVMNQWVSAFMERGLLLPKVVGDILGMCGFVAMIGLGRMLNGLFGRNMHMNRLLIGGATVCTAGYLVLGLVNADAAGIVACMACGFSVSLLWPGTLVVSHEKFPLAGAWMFGILASAGNIGGAVGPWITGLVMDNAAGQPFVRAFSAALGVTAEQGAMRFGIIVAAAFPAIAFVIHVILLKLKNSAKTVL